MSTNWQKHGVRKLTLYLLGFLLLWEWLRPLEVLTDTGNTGYFIVFIALALGLSYFHIHWSISFIVKTCFILFSLHALYFDGSFFQIQWLIGFIAELWYNIGLTFERQWDYLSYIFRSFLFFILLWLMTYLIHYWLMVKKSILLFFVMTVIYVGVLDTFTPYNGSIGIVRVIVSGFFLLGLLALEKVSAKERLFPSKRSKIRWIVPLVLMLAISSIVGFAAPKTEPIWPDPVPYLKSYSKNATGTISKIGYGPDDSQLGGPFIGDPSIVFEAEVENVHYWRIETKDFYTGKGWEHSELGDIPKIRFQPEQTVPSDPVYSNTGEVLSEHVNVQQQYDHLVYPYGLKAIETNTDTQLEYNLQSGKIISYENDEKIKLEEYILNYHEPSYSVGKMREITEVQPDVRRSDRYARFTQLPSTLPERVKQLAKEITKDKENWYDKVKAIEGFFAREGFEYNQKDVPIPKENEDYVDQFLFETRRGYCDNFSTSMVVMVRSLGIPARWVKGYTAGEFVELLDNGKKLYKVSNNNAHSWVEVYFPEIGWVPFEPTVGYSNWVNYEMEAVQAEEVDTAPEEDTEDSEQSNQQEEDSTKETKEESAFAKWFNHIQSMANEYSGGIITVLISSILMITALFVYRRKWIPYLLIFYYRKKSGVSIFTNAYLSLIKQFERSGIKLKDGQTLRAYSYQIDTLFGTDEMSTLTKEYEKTLYGKKSSIDDWEKMRECWENLIKRTTG